MIQNYNQRTEKTVRKDVIVLHRTLLGPTAVAKAVVVVLDEGLVVEEQLEDALDRCQLAHVLDLPETIDLKGMDCNEF